MSVLARSCGFGWITATRPAVARGPLAALMRQFKPALLDGPANGL